MKYLMFVFLQILALSVPTSMQAQDVLLIKLNYESNYAQTKCRGLEEIDSMFTDATVQSGNKTKLFTDPIAGAFYNATALKEKMKGKSFYLNGMVSSSNRSASCTVTFTLSDASSIPKLRIKPFSAPPTEVNTWARWVHTLVIRDVQYFVRTGNPRPHLHVEVDYKVQQESNDRIVRHTFSNFVDDLNNHEGLTQIMGFELNAGQKDMLHNVLQDNLVTATVLYDDNAKTMTCVFNCAKAKESKRNLIDKIWASLK